MRRRACSGSIDNKGYFGWIHDEPKNCNMLRASIQFRFVFRTSVRDKSVPRPVVTPSLKGGPGNKPPTNVLAQYLTVTPLIHINRGRTVTRLLCALTLSHAQDRHGQERKVHCANQFSARDSAMIMCQACMPKSNSVTQKHDVFAGESVCLPVEGPEW